ncbi:flagellar filament capping protein FliD [Thalassolituus hydrocarboniclasticus]|uniref:Filament cap protein n=1 Tax=Thalassolituus hydrocarboniclasticus TaxID=2742796 RepID=A0ABY6AC73_9GAMM|nr:flagellar filament capping protein FliD [Thalassolituus hydrocarboniclasticus]UXD88252.1 flagellar filament capping protein FliD [Thalassolituus hydrocarboniclasticus]
MASIESLGLGSGVLTTDLVEKIISAEKEATSLRLDSRQQLVEAKITAYGEIQSMMAKVQSAANNLSSPSLVSSTTATSSDEDILTATTSSLSEPGTYNVEVLNTAKSHSLATQTYSSFDEIIGIGKLVFTFGDITYGAGGNFVSQDLNPDRLGKTITIDDSNRTLSGIRDAINNADMGVTASIINDGSGYRLLMTSEETGAENAMRIVALDESGAMLSGGLGALAFNENQNTAANMSQTSRGEDAQLNVNGLTITRSSNSVDEVIKGVTLNLKNADVGKNISVTVSADTDKLSESIQGFVDAYNELKTFVDDLSGYDVDKQQAGLLLGDSTIRTMMSQIRAMISEPIVGLTGKYRSLTELGVDTNRDNDYQLDFNTAKFKKAMTEDRASIVGLLAKSGTTTDSQITYVNDSINTKPGTYDVNITQLASQAKYVGGSLSSLDFSSPVVIDESNDNFRINVNGQTASIELTHGSYSSGEDLAKQLALQINSSETLSKYGHSVSVDYSATDKNFSITSNKYGSESQVYFAAVDPNLANTLGFNKLGQGTYQGVELTTLNAEAFNGKGATTQIGNTSVSASTGINFSVSNASFSLDVDGNGPVAVVVNQNANGQDLNGDGVFGDRKDTLQAIQTAIDATALNGQVTASFDDNGYLIFETVAEGTARSIELTAVGTNTSDVQLGLNGTQGVQTNGKDPGLTFGSPVEFNVQVDGIESATKVSVPAGTYATGDALAAEIQNQLNITLAADANFAGAVKGAETATATRDISTNIDFSATNAGFRLNVSGVEKDVLVNSDSGDNIVDIQTALDNAFGAGVVSASLDGTGLKLTTVATGHEEYIEVVSDGRGAQSSSFADISAGIDFSGGQNATFTLTLDGVDINVDVSGDGTTGSNNADSNLIVIQQALDTALAATGQFAAGDVKARVDDSGQLYFETQSKDGVKTAATFGSGAALEIKNLGGTALSSLGLAAETVSNGYDGLGLTDTSRTFGYDLDAVVDYVYDPESDLGSLNITIGGQGTAVGFTGLDSSSIAFLGLQDVSQYSPSTAKGKDVAGTINGIEATGSGQFLRAVDGNVKASNGYYIGNEAADFSTPVNIDATNNTFKIKIDGVEAEVTLNQPATYNSGATLAQALQQAINDTAAFKDESIAVKVEFTDDPASFANNKFGIISASTGASSSVEIMDFSNEAAAVFGFVRGAGDGEPGKDQVGTIDDASGLRLKVTGGNVGERGSVTYITGFGDQLKDIMDSFLNGQKSVIGVKQSGLDDELEAVDEDRSRMEARISAQEARLKAQFLYNDSIISTLNTTLDYVKQQFEAMNNSKK